MKKYFLASSLILALAVPTVFGLSTTTQTTSQWQTGYCQEISVLNTDTATVSNWKIAFSLPKTQQITSLWGGKHTLAQGVYTVVPESWNAQLTPSKTAIVGFCAQGQPELHFDALTIPVTTPTVVQAQAKQESVSFSNGLVASITTTSDWTTGYCRSISLQNPTTTPQTWKLQYLGNFSVQGWGGSFVSLGNFTTITPETWNATVAPNATVTAGFCAQGSARDSGWSGESTPLSSVSPPPNHTIITPTPSTTPTPFAPIPLPQGTFPLTLSGNRLYDARGNIFTLVGVNWFGMETQDLAPHGLWARSLEDMVQQIQQTGFNAVRLPICPKTLTSAPVSTIDYAKNPQLQGKNALQILDAVIQAFAQKNIAILLDHHRSDCNSIADLPIANGYTQDQWIADLQFMAQRYAQIPQFIGIDLKNEPHGTARWGNGGSNDWKILAENAGAAVLQKSSRLLIFVEGIEKNDGNCEGNQNHFWGGNLESVRCLPIDSQKIPRKNLVYSPHVYGPDVSVQPYFQTSDYPKNLPAIWDAHFGYLSQDYVVIPGEFGGKYGQGDTRDIAWQNTFVDYMIQKKLPGYFYWSWNPNSGDTGGILQDDWKTLQLAKVQNLQRFVTEQSPTPSNISPQSLSGTVLAGYYPDWGRYSSTSILQDIPKFSLVLHAFVSPTDAGGITYASDFDPSIPKKALQNTPAKLLLSVGGYTASSSFSRYAQSASAHSLFVTQLVQFVHTHGYDGVDIDWEFPQTEIEKQYLLFLLDDLRAKLPGKYVTVALPIAPSYRSYDVVEIAKRVDYIFIMSYDIEGGWNGFAGHNAPLYKHPSAPVDLSIDTLLHKEFLHQGISAKKLVLGFPFYGRKFSVAQPYMAANTSETVEYRQLPFSQCSRVFDATTKTPILSCGMSYYSYDDAESWQWKLKYAQDKGLAGMFVWAIGQDNGAIFQNNIAPSLISSQAKEAPLSLAQKRKAAITKRKLLLESTKKAK